MVPRIEYRAAAANRSPRSAPVLVDSKSGRYPEELVIFTDNRDNEIAGGPAVVGTGKTLVGMVQCLVPDFEAA